MLYDVFICHAGEDKDEIVRPLAKLLREARVAVWYDEFELEIGDSLRNAIDLGLSQSRFGMVVLSRAFFEKGWPQWELNGLVQRDVRQAGSLILPVWHGVSHDDVLEFSPSLADKYAVRTEQGAQYVADELLKVLRPQGSTLLIARDVTIDHGLAPPVVTDDWWLDVVEYAGSRNSYESWEFPMQPGDEPEVRGRYIAWHAMQMVWTAKAERDRICQLTSPSDVLAFITESPGLMDMCRRHPIYLGIYAPQLTLKGFGGPFEDQFQEWEEEILEGRTNRGVAPAYDSVLNFRLFPKLESRPAHLACQWVQGELMGPHIRVLEPFEYVCWILSMQSEWLPLDTRDMLATGLKEWEVWNWSRGMSTYGEEWPTSGCLFRDLHELVDGGRAGISDEGVDDLQNRMHLATQLLSTPEEPDELVRRFLEAGFIDNWISEQQARRSTAKN